MKRKIIILILTLSFALCLSFGLAACTKREIVSEPPATDGEISGTGAGTAANPYRPDTAVENSGLAFELNEAGDEYTVTGIGSLANEESIVIPATYNDKPVTAIGDDAFKLNDKLLTVTIPDGIKTIGVGAFSSCISLTAAIIPDSVESLGEEVFSGCSSLIFVKIGKGVSQIPAQAFLQCASLVAVNASGKVAIPNNVRTIESQAFEECINISEVETGAGVNTICDHAFFNCTGLNSVNFGAGVNTIETFAFAQCSSIKELKVPNNVKKIEISAFEKCSSIEKISLPFVGESVYKADEDDNGQNNFFFAYIFGAENRSSNYGSLDEDDAQREYIDKYLPTKLTTVEIDGSGANSGPIDYMAFNYCYNIKTLILGEGVTELREGSLYNMMGLENIVIPASVRKIETAALWNCVRLDKVYYGGTSQGWNTLQANIDYDRNNQFQATVSSGRLYFFNRTNPFLGSVTSGNFWHFDADGNIEEWAKP